MSFPTSLLRSYKRNEENKSKSAQDVAPCSRPTINVIGPLHECKKVCPSSCTKALLLSSIRAWIKQGQKKMLKRGRETEARRLMKRKAAQQNKNTTEELKQGVATYLGTVQVNKAWGGMLNLP